ncbi:MAG: T9SS type A sorting domain-containing protein [Saprospiraceae bacterium]|nr:T9SS type A sorting domain-containing protein [Saprospiraceae bacterium]
MKRQLLRRYYLLGLTLILTIGCSSLFAQGDPVFKRDSVYVGKGINNTNDFENDRRIYFIEEDEQGRVLEKIIHRKNNDGEFEPFRRHLTSYDGPNLTQFVIQAWELMGGEWISIREDNYTFENDLLVNYLRRTLQEGVLADYRQWIYTFDEDDNEIEVNLQEMQEGEWVNRSRKQQSYNEEGDLLTQTLQKWVDNAWKNSRQRDWDYDMASGVTRKVTLSAWDTPTNEWIEVFIQTFSYNADSQWTGSSFQAWDQDNEVWVNTQRTQYLYNNQRNPIGQIMQLWENDEWRNNLRGGLTIENETQIAQIQQWDASADDWTNFLRYQQTIDANGITQEKLGMERWDSDSETWINRNFTQRFTYFWSEQVVNALQEVALPENCQLANPYQGGMPILCDLTGTSTNLQVELYDMMGRRVLQQSWASAQEGSIDSPPVPGLYLLRITQDQQTQHLQKIVIQ